VRNVLVIRDAFGPYFKRITTRGGAFRQMEGKPHAGWYSSAAPTAR
jgi:hypothetical protein